MESHLPPLTKSSPCSSLSAAGHFLQEKKRNSEEYPYLGRHLVDTWVALLSTLGSRIVTAPANLLVAR